MTRYYFDLRDDDGITVDEEGMELSNTARVQEEAARSVADMARDLIMTDNGTVPREMAIGVRDDAGPLLDVRLSFKVTRLRDN